MRTLQLVLTGLLLIGSLGTAEPAQEKTKTEQPPAERIEKSGYTGLTVPGLSVRPEFSLRQEYHSNIFRADRGEEHDWVTVVSPGVSLDFSRGGLEVDASYRARILEYARHGDIDNTEHYLDGGFLYRFGHFFVGGDAAYRQTSDPIDLPITRRLIIYRRRYAGLVGFTYDPWTVKLRYTTRDYDVDEDIYDFLDYVDRGTKLSIRYRLSPHWKFRAGIGMGEQKYEEIKNDSNYEEYTAGFQWVPHRRFGIIVDAGYRSDDYDPDSGSLPGFDGDYSGPVVRLTAEWLPWDEGAFTFTLSRSPADSVLSNFIAEDRVGVSYVHQISDRWSARVDGHYAHAEESESLVPQETKHTFGAGGSVNWRITDWLSAEVGYRYEDKSTHDGTGEYVDHIVSVGMTAGF